MAKKLISGEFSTVFVETGSNWFKIIEAEQSAKGLRVSRVHLEKFEDIGRGLSQSIAAAFKKKKFSKTPVVSCIPRQMVNIRMLELPSTDTDEIVDMVGFQAGKQTPYSKDEIAFDYKMLASARDGYTRVLLAIVQRSVLRQRFSILEEAGLEIARMSVSSEGVLSWYEQSVKSEQTAPGATVLLDIDSTYSDFMVISRGVPVFTRSILIGADQLTGNFDVAKDEFLQEINRSMDACRGESSELEIGSMVLSGAAPQIAGLSEHLAGQLGFSVKNRDCLHDVSKMPAQPVMSEYPTVSLTSLMGMASAPDQLEFNMIPDSVKLRKELVEKAQNLTSFGILVMTLMICASTLIVAKLFYKEARLKTLKHLVGKTDSHASEVDRQEAIIDVVDKRSDPTFAVINILSEVHVCVPDGTVLEEIEVKTGDATVRLRGSALARADVRTLVAHLERSKLFINAKSESESRDPKTRRVVFDVVCLLEKKPDA